MPSLDYFLNRINDSVNRIQSIKPCNPGIFTNSFIAEPSITTLLKDAEDYEAALYQIRKPRYTIDSQNEVLGQQFEARPERVDGKSIYLDHSFDEFTSGNELKHKRIAVKIPQLVSEDKSINNSDKNSQLPSPTNILNIGESKDVKDIIDATLDLIRKYPHLVSAEEEETILSYNEKYISLSQEISKLENQVNEQKDQLAIHNVTLSDSVLMSSPSKSRSDSRSDDIEIDELIRQEEIEIEELEFQLQQHQKTNS